MGGPFLAALSGAFLSGLALGFGHCAAMCGPLVGSFALAAAPSGVKRSLGAQLAYHAGRITTYALVGGAMGLSGAFLNVAGRLAGLQEVVAILSGLLLVLLGLSTAGVLSPLRRLEARLSARFARLVRLLLEGGGAGRLYPLGLCMGLLPCGASYTAFLGAAGTGKLLEGLLFSLLFGLGTLPALLLVGAAATAAGLRLRGVLYRLGGVLVTLVGIYFLLRGLGYLGR